MKPPRKLTAEAFRQHRWLWCVLWLGLLCLPRCDCNQSIVLEGSLCRIDADCRGFGLCKDGGCALFGKETSAEPLATEPDAADDAGSQPEPQAELTPDQTRPEPIAPEEQSTEPPADGPQGPDWGDAKVRCTWQQTWRYGYHSERWQRARIQLAMRNQSTVFFSLDGEGRLFAHDMTKGQQLGARNMSSSGQTAQALALSHDERWLAMGQTDTQGTYVALWPSSSAQQSGSTVALRLRLPIGAGQLKTLAFGQGSTRLAAGTSKGWLLIWSLTQSPQGNPASRQLFAKAAHSASISRVRFQPNSTRLATAGLDKLLLFWEEKQGATFKMVSQRTFKEPVQDLAFFPKGRYYAVFAELLTVFDQSTDKVALTLFRRAKAGSRLAVTSGTCCPDTQSQFLAASIDDKLEVWEISQDNLGLLSEQSRINHQTNAVPFADLVFAPNTASLFAATQEAQVIRWTADTSDSSGFRRQDLVSQSYSFAISQAQTLVAKSRLDGHIDLIDPKTGTIGTSFRAFSPGLSKLLFVGGDPRLLAIAKLSTNALHFWQLTYTGNTRYNTWQSATVKVPGADVTQLEQHPTGQFLFTGDAEGKIRIWSVAAKDPEKPNPKLVRLMTAPGKPDFIDEMTVSPDGAWLVTGHRDRQLRLWDISLDPQGIPKGTLQATIPHANTTIQGLAFRPDSKALLSGNPALTLRHWTLSQHSGQNATLTEQASFQLPVSQGIHATLSLLFHPNGTHFFSLTKLLQPQTPAPHGLSLWESKTKQRNLIHKMPLRHLLLHDKNNPTLYAFSRRSAHIFSCTP